MKRFIILAIFPFLFSTIDANAIHTEDWETKTYDIEDFTDLYIEGGYKVYLTQGDENEVIIKASDDDVFDYIQVKNNGDRLTIDVEPDHYDFDRIILYITFKQMEKLHIEGGVKLQTKGYIDLDDFYMYVAGGAKIELNLKADDVKIIGEGGVLFELDGVARSLDVKISGAGHVDADELKSKHVKFRIEGVGTGSVYATETLHANIEGVGRVKYYGDPKVTKNIEGLGSVTSN